MNESSTMIVSEDAGERLDSYLVDQFPEEVSRSFIQKLIRSGHVLLNEKTCKPKDAVKVGDVIQVSWPEVEVSDVLAEDIPLEIVFEDEHLCVINKQPGLVVHPAFGHTRGTLVNALLHHSTHWSNVNGSLRPGIVHRLDKDTSGLMVVAKTNQAHAHLAAQLAERSLKRRYFALCSGTFPEERLELCTQIGRSKSDRKLMAVVQVGGKEAISTFEVQERFQQFTALYVHLQTGRTHQIRVHLKHLGYPIVGDQVYNRHKTIRINQVVLPLKRQALHAQKITFVHPVSGQSLSFKTALPEDIEQVLSLIRAQEEDLGE